MNEETKVRHRFQSLSVKPEQGRTLGRGFPFPESGKQLTRQSTTTVMVNPTIGLAELLGGCHCSAFNPHRLKGEAARALANKLLVFRHIYKLAQHGFPVKQGKERRQDDRSRKAGLAEKDI